MIALTISELSLLTSGSGAEESGADKQLQILILQTFCVTTEMINVKL